MIVARLFIAWDAREKEDRPVGDSVMDCFAGLPALTTTHRSVRPAASRIFLDGPKPAKDWH